MLGANNDIGFTLIIFIVAVLENGSHLCDMNVFRLRSLNSRVTRETGHKEFTTIAVRRLKYMK
jgi:hypothetical protein